jgi:aldehyde:ferredoxin oxidoreductase
MVPLVFEAGTKRLHGMVLRLLAWFPLISQSLVKIDSIADLLSCFSGVKMSSAHLMDVGRRAVFLKQLINDSPQSYPAEIPERFSLDPESNHKGNAVVPYRALVQRYRFLRALDLAKIEES